MPKMQVCMDTVHFWSEFWYQILGASGHDGWGYIFQSIAPILPSLAQVIKIHRVIHIFTHDLHPAAWNFSANKYALHTFNGLWQFSIFFSPMASGSQVSKAFFGYPQYKCYGDTISLNFHQIWTLYLVANAWWK